MKANLHRGRFAPALALGLGLGLTLNAAPADAKGCIKGAIHHGVLGAAAGCLIGHHEAKQRARERAMQNGASDHRH